jgi:hypothetical protein
MLERRVLYIKTYLLFQMLEQRKEFHISKSTSCFRDVGAKSFISKNLPLVSDVGAKSSISQNLPLVSEMLEQRVFYLEIYLLFQMLEQRVSLSMVHHPPETSQMGSFWSPTHQFFSSLPDKLS